MPQWLTMGFRMSNRTAADFRRSLEAELQQSAPPEWVRQMIGHYHRTGSYRPKDLRRLLGDPKKGVEVGSQASLASYFSQD